MNNLEAWLKTLGETATPDFAECCYFLATYFPLLNEFSKTEQDPEWHGEGDVAIHTDMVLKELYVLLEGEAKHIQNERRTSLILSALLHDIAKPRTTSRREIRGTERVIAKGHEDIGRDYLSFRLLKLPLSYAVITQVLGLVGYHQIPKLLVVRDKGYAEYLRLALNADLTLLYWLEVADMKGRVCPDLHGQLELLEQFRMFAEDFELWENTDVYSTTVSKIQIKGSKMQQVFTNGYAVNYLINRRISMQEEAVAKSYQHAEDYGHLYVMCGVSGSGKSTWINKNLSGFELISLDEIRSEINGSRLNQKNLGQVLQIAKKRLKTALAKKINVVWDATNIRKDFRKIICDFGRDYHSLVTLVVFHLPEKVLLKNNNNRQHTIDEHVLSDQLSKFQWPEAEEAHRVIYVGDQGETLATKGSF